MALMHMIETELSSSQRDLRVSAMHDRSPIHTFMFDNEGNLLSANKMALLACQRDLGGDLVLLCQLMLQLTITVR